MTPLLPLLESELGGLQGCVMSARLRFPAGSQWVPWSEPPRLCLTSRPPAGSHWPSSSCERQLLARAEGDTGQTQRGGASSTYNLGNCLRKKNLKFWIPILLETEIIFIRRGHHNKLKTCKSWQILQASQNLQEPTLIRNIFLATFFLATNCLIISLNERHFSISFL